MKLSFRKDGTMIRPRMNFCLSIADVRELSLIDKLREKGIGQTAIFRRGIQVLSQEHNLTEEKGEK